MPPMHLQEALKVFGDLRRRVDAPDELVAAALRTYSEDEVTRNRGLSMQGEDGSPDWLGYEDCLWRESEDIRQSWVRQKRKRRNNELIAVIIELVADERFGKGRQNFLLMLGRFAEFGARDYAPLLIPLLSQDGVNGHAAQAAIALRVRGLDTHMSSLRSSKAAWLRNAAKKYLQKYGERAPG